MLFWSLAPLTACFGVPQLVCGFTMVGAIMPLARPMALMRWPPPLPKFQVLLSVTIHNYWLGLQDTANEIMAAPPGDRIVISGYSCGANGSTTIAYGINPHRRVDVAVIQESLYCGGYSLLGNVNRAQETYAAGLWGCLVTLGFGCKEMQAGPGFAGQLVLIDRPDLHPWADDDPNAQNDILSFIAGTTPTLQMRHGPRVIRMIRYNGQRP